MAACTDREPTRLDVGVELIKAREVAARESLFVDPWSRAPDHQGDVPAGALFVGAWENDVFIDTYNEALFLVRGDRQDLLWSLADYAGKPIRRGCVAGAPHAGTDKQAAKKLLNALVRARMPRFGHFAGLTRNISAHV